MDLNTSVTVIAHAESFQQLGHDHVDPPWSSVHETESVYFERRSPARCQRVWLPLLQGEALAQQETQLFAAQ